jgi:hypothetical protein
VDIHQGDATSVRDEAGSLHQVILRRYRDQPGRWRAGRGTAADAPGPAGLRARLGAADEDVASEPGAPAE